jgi:hypothetical protein
MDEMPDFMKQFFQILQLGQVDQGSWVNVAKLSSEDQLKKKNYDMQLRRLVSEGKVLFSKLQVVRATIEANKAEFWDEVYKTYNLPSDLNYKIDEQGQVSKHVAAPPAENA